MYSRKKLTTDEFIKRAKDKHGDKYDYSLVNYINGRTKITIICPIHGEFQQKARTHLHSGCFKCGRKSCGEKNKNKYKYTTSSYIEKAKEIHGDKYDYSMIIYHGWSQQINIRCPKHGDFYLRASSFLQGSECPKCRISNRDPTLSKRYITKEKFIEKAKTQHGDKYDYSLVNYVNSRTKITIICPIHGEFQQYPNNHYNGAGCHKCSALAGAKKRASQLKLTTEDFITRAREIHGDKYDYSKTIYKTVHENLIITCPEHGDFNQRPSSHIHKKAGCRKCALKIHAGVFKTLSQEEVICKFKKIHGDRYDYSKVKYKKSNINVTIICPIHGEFEQLPANHEKGCGCPKCGKSFYREQWLREVLEELFSTKFPSTKPEWLNTKDTPWSAYELDCFNKELKLAVEYQGVQHYQPVPFFGGKASFDKQIVRDRKKKNLCDLNNVILWRIDGRKLNNKGEESFKEEVKKQLLDLAQSNIYTPSWHINSKKIKKMLLFS